MPSTTAEPDQSELKSSAFNGVVKVLPSLQLPDASQFGTWRELDQATVQSRHGAATPDSPIKASDFISAERALHVQAQADSSPADVKALHPVSSKSRLSSLAPEYKQETGLIHVGGRLCRAAELDTETIHPIILDSRHPFTKFLIKDCDERLHYAGAEHVLAELQRHYWILRGRETIRKHQYICRECRF